MADPTQRPTMVHESTPRERAGSREDYDRRRQMAMPDPSHRPVPQIVAFVVRLPNPDRPPSVGVPYDDMTVGKPTGISDADFRAIVEATFDKYAELRKEAPHARPHTRTCATTRSHEITPPGP